MLTETQVIYLLVFESLLFKCVKKTKNKTRTYYYYFLSLVSVSENNYDEMSFLFIPMDPHYVGH